MARSKRSSLLPAIAGGVVLAGAIATGVVWLQRPDEWVQELIDANPGWEIQKSVHGTLRVTERATGASLLVAEDEAGRFALRRVPCAAMAPLVPGWFRLPPDASDPGPTGCLHLGAPGHEVYVTNFRTAIGVPEIWRDFYEPLLGDYEVDSWGGGSVAVERASEGAAASQPAGSASDASPPSSDARRLHNSIGYRVEPRGENPTRQTRLAAFYLDGRTLVVVSFRDVAR